jgi:predicted DNA-binding transcriptional regulator AlpA
MEESDLPSGPLFLRARAVAKMLDVSLATLADWRQAGRGPRYVRLSGDKRTKVRYRVSDLERWIARRSIESSDATLSAEMKSSR